MNRNKFLKNTLLLVLGGFLTKIIRFITKILYTRYLKSEGVSLVTLTFPTYALLLTISSFALPLAVTKLTAENKKRKSKILFSSFWITSFINIVIIILTFMLSDLFATKVLHEPRCAIFLKILCLTLPFISTTSLIKAYFFGVENVIPIVISNVLEEIIKLSMVIIFLPKFIEKSIMAGVTFYLIINFFCEVISFFSLYIFLPRKIKYKKLEYKYDSKCGSDMAKICIPTLSGKLIGNIGFFFEPIILTNLLLYKGYTSSYIRLNYGYFQGYVIALLTIPSFYLLAFSNNIIPLITKLKASNKIKEIKKIIKKIISITLVGGIFFTLILRLYGLKLMLILYKTTNGYIYLIKLLPFFILFYLESPLLSILQSLDQEKKVLRITTYGIIVKYLSLATLILFNVGFNSLVISEIINIIFVILISTYYLKKYFYRLSR